MKITFSIYQKRKAKLKISNQARMMSQTEEGRKRWWKFPSGKKWARISFLCLSLIWFGFFRLIKRKISTFFCRIWFGEIRYGDLKLIKDQGFFFCNLEFSQLFLIFPWRHEILIIFSCLDPYQNSELIKFIFHFFILFFWFIHFTLFLTLGRQWNFMRSFFWSILCKGWKKDVKKTLKAIKKE